MWADEFVKYLKEYGVSIDIRSGWKSQSAGRGNWINDVPDGFMEHHFVNPYSSRDGVNMIEKGYSGGPRPYVVNLYLEGDGLLRLVSAYPTGHPGIGSRAVLNRVLNDEAPLGDAAAVGVGNDLTQIEAEKRYFGMEVQNPGDGTPLSGAQYRVMPLIGAAWCRATGHSPNRVIQHREHTDRKPDIHRAALNADKNRADISNVLSNSVVPPIPPMEDPMAMNVIRDKGTQVDYLFSAPFVFVKIESREAYDRYLSAGIITTPHDQVKGYEGYEVNWYRDKIVAWRIAAGLPNATDVETVVPKA